MPNWFSAWYLSLGVSAISFLLTSSVVFGNSGLRDIPSTWQPSDMRILRSVEAAASTSIGEPYEPAMAIDGKRHTKWVAKDTPSSDSPQWITIRLSEPQKVSAVAVFGSPVDNDGVIDAVIQVAGDSKNSFFYRRRGSIEQVGQLADDF